MFHIFLKSNPHTYKLSASLHRTYDVLQARQITVAEVQADECTITYVVKRHATPNPVGVDEYAANG